MNKWLAPALSCLALGIALAGCGGDDDDEDGGGARTTEQPAETSPQTGPAAAGRTVSVAMEDIQYVPQDVKVRVGGTVEWTNSDSVTHTVTKRSGPGPRFDSGNMQVGATFERRFDRPGTVNYVCTIHPNQAGTVTVE